MTARVTSTGTITTSDYYTIANGNDPSGGWIFRAEVTSNQGSITTLADLTSLTTGSFTTPLRTFLIMFDLTFSNTNAGEQVEVQLFEDSTELKRFNFYIGIANAGQSCTGFYLRRPSNAAHTYKLAAKQSGSGTGTLTLLGSAAGASPPHPEQFIVLDVGPQ